MKTMLMGWLLAVAGCLWANGSDIRLETPAFTLTVGADAKAKSLVLKANGEEMLDAREGVPLFSVTQDRPFNNEIKLIWPHKRTTFRANRLRQEDDRLIVGFELAEYEAVVRVKAGDGYLRFELEDFRCAREVQYEGLVMDVPPVDAFRVLQLPVRDRANIGGWLNVVWDDRGVAAVVAADPYVEADHERRQGFEILSADLRKGLRLRGGSAALVAGAGREAFLRGMEALENDCDLPRGVAARRNPLLKQSIYWTTSISPANVDSHIALAKKAGLRLMLIYFPAFDRAPGYRGLGDYDFNANYPNGLKDVKLVLDKIKAAGITPGYHTLQTHIGKESRYVTPVADPRLNLTRRFTLAAPIPAEGDVAEISVLENPVDAPSWTTSERLTKMRYGTAKVLKFGGELFSYEGYTTTPPYRFTGVRRGHWATRAAAHPYGEIGGVLDVSEYCAQSCYIDQRTDLQDEIGRKIARICDQGMEFCYFDGSEGVHAPCGVNVALSQWRVISKFRKPPVFVEGAAKSHFGWHLQAGANAFDVFPPEVFKEMIVRFPLAEAPIMQKEMTRLDFGWWKLYQPGTTVDLKWSLPHRKVKSVGTQMDMWEFGTSRAAAWDCPATVMMDPGSFVRHPRAKDLLEVMRRWEDVRINGFLTPERKQALKSATQEHHLYLNEKGEYELHEIEMLPTSERAPALRGFVFTRKGRRVIACWHVSGAERVRLTLDGTPQVFEVGDLRYIETDMSAADVRSSFAAALAI